VFDIVADAGHDCGVGDHDRNAILARRALFISAALAGLACTAHESANEPDSGPGTKQVDPPNVVVESPNPTVDEPRPVDGARPSWSEIMAAAPPLDVPEGLTANERELLTNLASRVRERYQELGKIWSALPECSPSEADCQAWARAIDGIANASSGGWGPLCGYSPEVTATHLQREGAHAWYLRDISDRLLAELDATVEARANPADTKAWQVQRARLELGHARPCLSCVAPTAEPITDAIPFGPGEAKLTRSTDVDNQIEAASSTHQHNRNYRCKLIVRGHASADETDPDSLARQRAEAVAEALIERGANRRHLEIRSYGASLPISNNPAEAALNRRVDFEVVVP